MSIIEIFMYSIGSVFFFSALAFTYYSIQCARVMRGALGRKMMACGALLFIIAGIIGAIDAFFFPGSGLAYGTFSVWIIALITLVIGGFLVGKALQKVAHGSLVKQAFIMRRGIYYLIGFVALIFVGVPVSILDISQPLQPFSWYSVVSIAVRAFCFINLVIGARMDYLTAKPSAAAAAAAADKARAEEAEKYTKELKKSYEELKTLDKMKSDFISIAAHELRTPLTPVRAYIELIKAGKLGRTEWRQIEKLNIAEKNIDLLVKLIDDMLDVTRIEAGKLDMRKEVLSVGEIIDIALDRVKLRMGERRHRIGIHVPDDLPPIYGDKELMVKVFDNLLSNAMKYTPATTSKIMIEAKKEGKNIYVNVADTGIGIPKKDLEKIFERFYLIDSSLTREHRGIGLGLAITKGIVEAHNGKIWAESKGLGKGSTFHVVLPVMGKEK